MARIVLTMSAVGIGGGDIRTVRPSIWVTLLATIGVGCTGWIEDASSTNRSERGPAFAGQNAPSAPAGDIDSVDPSACEAEPAPPAMRLLTRYEYERTASELLGEPVEVGTVLLDDTRVEVALNEGFETNVEVSVDRLRLAKYREMAGNLGQRVAAKARTLAGCGSDTATACLDQFLRTFGRRVFRRPLLPSEITGLEAVFAARGGSFEDGAGLVAEAMFQSIPFLYHFYPGDPSRDQGAFRPLTGYEVAARLSFLLHGAGPDDRLLDAAAAGELDSETGVRAWAETLLAEPAAQDRVARIHEEWLWIDELEEVSRTPETLGSTPVSILSDMREETREFVKRIVFNETGSLQELLGSRLGMFNGAMADLYGVSAPAGDTMSWGPQPRAGILTQASWLTRLAAPDYTSPTKRGIFVVNELLCQSIILPDELAVPSLPSTEEFRTTRERFAAHGELPCAAGCHGVFDPIGFSFENFDELGRYRETENGYPVDASGSVQVADVNVTYDNALPLIEALAESDRVKRCYAANIFEYALGRHRYASEACETASLSQGFEVEDDITQLLVEITGSYAFRYRSKCL